MMKRFDDIVAESVVPQLRRRGLTPNTDDRAEMMFIIETAKRRGVTPRTLSFIIEKVLAHRADMRKIWQVEE